MRYVAAYTWPLSGETMGPAVFHYDPLYNHSRAFTNAAPCPKCIDGYLLYQIRKDADCCNRCGFERPL